MSLKKATEEETKLLFEWVNEEMCRKNSFFSELITYEEHAEWLKCKLHSGK